MRGTYRHGEREVGEEEEEGGMEQQQVANHGR